MSAPPLPPGLSPRASSGRRSRPSRRRRPDAVLSSSDTRRRISIPSHPAMRSRMAAAAVVMPTSVEQVARRSRRGESISRAVVDRIDGTQLRLRRRVAASCGMRRARFAADEPHHRDRREARLCARRTGRELLRPVSRADGAPRASLARSARGGLGQRDRQHARTRLRHDAYGDHAAHAVRHGSGARERRSRAHRHGRDERRAATGRCSSPASDLPTMRCSCSRTSASSRSSGSGSCPRPRAICSRAMRSNATTISNASSIRCARSSSTTRFKAAPSSKARCAGRRAYRRANSGTTARARCPKTAIDAMARKIGIGRWNLRFCLYGPQALVNARRDIVHAALFPDRGCATLFELPYRDAAVEPEGRRRSQPGRHSGPRSVQPAQLARRLGRARGFLAGVSAARTRCREAGTGWCASAPRNSASITTAVSRRASAHASHVRGHLRSRRSEHKRATPAR